MRAFLVLTIFIATSYSSLVHALEDTPENREAEAHRYSEAMEVEGMMGDMAEALSMNFPPERREEFKKFMLEYVDYGALEQANTEAMVRHFTAEELQALADFHSKPIAKSAMKKLGPYMAEFMPFVEAEMMRALGQLRRAEAERNRENAGSQE